MLQRLTLHAPFMQINSSQHVVCEVHGSPSATQLGGGGGGGDAHLVASFGSHPSAQQVVPQRVSPELHGFRAHGLVRVGVCKHPYWQQVIPLVSSWPLLKHE